MHRLYSVITALWGGVQRIWAYVLILWRAALLRLRTEDLGGAFNSVDCVTASKLYRLAQDLS